MKWFGRKKNPAAAEDDDVVVVSKETPYSADHDTQGDTQGGRQSHLCFSRICDMRIGTLAANTLNIILRIVLLCLEVAWGKTYPISTDYCAIILSAVAIFGALNYEHLPVGLAALGLACIAIIHVLWGAAWYGIIYDILVLYPTSVLTVEIYKGIITEDTYKREEYLQPEIREQWEIVVEKNPGNV